jgi:hypothetical protein
LLRIYKKDSGVSAVTYAEALDQALCFGWIDGQKRPNDKQSWLQKFTPRRPKSGWSKNNTRHAERLIKTGEMAPSGLKQVKAAKADGRWKAAYDSFGMVFRKPASEITRRCEGHYFHEDPMTILDNAWTVYRLALSRSSTRARCS